MDVTATLNRPYQSRPITWSGSVNSSEIVIEGGSSFNIYVDDDFAGSQVSVLAFVDDATGFVPYSATAVAVTAGEVTDLTAMNLFGIRKVKFVSDATETCTGRILYAS